MNKDFGQFHGTTRMIEGQEVPTGYGYMVLPYYRSKEGHTVTRKHQVFIQGDWMVTSVESTCFQLQVFG